MLHLIISLEQSWGRESPLLQPRLAVSADLFLFVYFLMDQVVVPLWALQACRRLFHSPSLSSGLVFIYLRV